MYWIEFWNMWIKALRRGVINLNDELDDLIWMGNKVGGNYAMDKAYKLLWSNLDIQGTGGGQCFGKFKRLIKEKSLCVW